MSENINEKIEKLQTQFIDNLNLDKKKYDKLKDEITTMKKDYKELEQNIQNKIEGLENHYNIKTLTNTINMLIDNNVKIRELEQKLSNFGETLGSQMGINLKSLRNIKELKQTLQELISAYEMEHMVELGLMGEVKNGDGKQDEPFIKCPECEMITKGMKGHTKWCKPSDPIEIIVERTHVIIKFENETRRYTYLEGRFMEPNQLLLILERDLETISETKKLKTISNVELPERLRAMVWNDGNEKKVNMNQFYTLIEELEEDPETTAKTEGLTDDGTFWAYLRKFKQGLDRYPRENEHPYFYNLSKEFIEYIEYKLKNKKDLETTDLRSNDYDQMIVKNNTECYNANKKNDKQEKYNLKNRHGIWNINPFPQFPKNLTFKQKEKEE